MKVAVLTLSLYANYGGNLQAYALMTALQDLGHEAWFLNRERHKIPAWKIPFALVQRVVQRYGLRRKVNLRAGIFDGAERATVAKHSRQFIARYIQPQTPEFRSSAQLVKAVDQLGFDAFVVGSDQVWRRRFVEANFTDYFFGFLPEADTRTRRIAYAASYGTSEWEFSPQETRRCAQLAKRFHAISVREDSGVALCREHLGASAEHVIDPTLLLTPPRYVQLIPEPEKQFNGVLLYMLDTGAERQQVIDAVVQRLALPVFRVNGNAAERAGPASERIAPPVEEWLRGFRDAQFVITDSFHGTVFAILFNKPFIAYGNPTRGMARFSSLLKMFGLEDRLVCGPDDLRETVFAVPDWASVNAKLASEREKAKAFLQRALDSQSVPVVGTGLAPDQAVCHAERGLS
jgi:hypothetical protein